LEIDFLNLQAADLSQTRTCASEQSDDVSEIVIELVRLRQDLTNLRICEAQASIALRQRWRVVSAARWTKRLSSLEFEFSSNLVD
jgi:hypothetical protein